MNEDKEAEYRKLFLQEATDNFEELNKLIIKLEKTPGDQRMIDSIFRIVHTVKGNAMGLGLEAIAGLTHVLEDVMGEVKQGTIALDSSLFESLFKAIDKLGLLLKSMETGERVSYLGIKTKLEVFLKNNRGSSEETEDHGPSTENEDVESDDTTPEITFTDVIQIPVGKMDELLNLVGQLIIEKDRLMTRLAQNGTRSEFDGLQRITSDLQYSILNARMVPMEFMFNKFHRIVRDAATIEQKKVDLKLRGADVEIDRNILKIISDALIHVTRNAVSHGIEDNVLRKKKGKPETGEIIMEALYEKDNVLIRVADDGAGIDPDALRQKAYEKGILSRDVAQSLSDQDAIMQIFQPGFSNAEKITEISGRGVGMDVVKKAVESIGGQVNVESTMGEGTIVNLLLPSSLALKAVLLLKVGEQEYGIPLSFTEGVVSVKQNEIRKIGTNLTIEYQEKTIPLIYVEDLLATGDLQKFLESAEGSSKKTRGEFEEVIVVSYTGKLLGLVVDKLMHRQEILEKPLPHPLHQTKLLSGTTILGNGNVCPVLDVAAICDLIFQKITLKRSTL